MLMEYIENNYEKNEPIFIADLAASGLKMSKIRMDVKKFVDGGILKRYDTGIYYLPKKTMFNLEAHPSRELVIEKKYLKDEEGNCGYISGLLLANQLGLTTQVPAVYEIVSNKATRDYREVVVGNATVVLRKPRVSITEENYKVLQFLDLIKDIDVTSELTGSALREKLFGFMEKAKISISMIKKYAGYYPEKIFKNMYEVGLLEYVSA